MNILLAKHKGQEIGRIPLEANQEYWMGRSEENSIVLDSSYGISRKHLKITYLEESATWKVECVSSLGGLMVEGQEVKEHTLTSDDIFYLQEFEFHFQTEKEQVKADSSENSSDKEDESHLFDRPATDHHIAPSNTEDPLEKQKQESQLEVAPDPDGSIKNRNTQNTGGVSPTVVQSSNNLKPVLVISLSEADEDKTVTLVDSDTWTVGRSPSCEICVEHINFSRKHFKIHKEDQEFFITDLESANGTYLNDSLLNPNQPKPIHSGDVISILDIKVFFDIINPQFKKESPDPVPMVIPTTNVPAGVSSPPATYPVPASPNVVMGETLITHAPPSSKKRKIIMMASVLLLVIGGIFFLQNDKDDANLKKDSEDPFQNLSAIDQERVQNFYTLAQKLYDMKKYNLCVDKLTELHGILPDYQQSHNLLNNCQNGAESIQAKKELQKREAEEKRIQALVKKNVKECTDQFDTFTSASEITKCLNPTIENDPENIAVSELVSRFEAIALERDRKKEESIKKKKRIAQVTNAYARIKKLKEENKTLQAIAAYKAFLSKKHPKGAASTIELAKQELEEMETELQNKIDKLNQQCESLLESKQYKEAYQSCIAILDVMPGYQKAIDNAQIAKNTINQSLKVIYEDSILNESLGNVDIAKKKWKEILEKDIPNGDYYIKANSKLSKY